MANGQFNIPDSFRDSTPERQNSPSYETQQVAPYLIQMDAQRNGPEVLQSPVASIKELTDQLSDRLDSYRSTAEVLEQSKRPWLKAAKGLIIAPKPILAELIEKESIIIGKLVQKQGPHQENRIWIQNRELFYGFIDKKNHISLDKTTVRYYFNAHNRYIKLFNGKDIPFVQGEIENLAGLLPMIEHSVMHELYPLDEAIDDLMHDDDDALDHLQYLDNLTNTNSVSELTEAKTEIKDGASQDDFKLAA